MKNIIDFALGLALLLMAVALVAGLYWMLGTSDVDTSATFLGRLGSH